MIRAFLKDNRYCSVLIVAWLALLTFISYGKSLGLSLYGDDWLTISKTLGPFSTGQWKTIFDPRIYFSNYGFQGALVTLVYVFFRDNAFPYFLFSLILRVIVSLGIFIFMNKAFSKKFGVLAASLFALSAIGAETTDWVYNFSTYLGLFVAMIGLKYFISDQKVQNFFLGLVFCLFAYFLVPIRLFVLPLLLVTMELCNVLVGSWEEKRKILSPLVKILAIISVFGLSKIIFPDIGWQQISTDMMQSGLKTAQIMLKEGRFDFLLYPFTNLGYIVLPIDLSWVDSFGTQFGLVIEYLSSTSILIFFSIVLIISFSRTLSKGLLLRTLVATEILILVLRIVVYYQGQWTLRYFPYLSSTLLGILLTFLVIREMIDAFLKKDIRSLKFYLISSFFVFAFIFSWIYWQPVGFFVITHRYLSLSALGLPLILGKNLLPQFTKSNLWKARIQILFLIVFAFSQIIAARNFFDFQLNSRTAELNEKLFAQIKSFIPIMSLSSHPIFYFENFPYPTYYELLYFGFGYHMQLLYNLPFDKGDKFPSSVNTIEELVKTVRKENTPLDHVFGFRWEGELIDISKQIRIKLLKNEGA